MTNVQWQKETAICAQFRRRRHIGNWSLAIGPWDLDIGHSLRPFLSDLVKKLRFDLPWQRIQSYLLPVEQMGFDYLTERSVFMKSSLKSLIVRLVRDEQGGEVLEYALIAGLIVVAAIAVIGSVGTKVLARWGSLNSSM